MKERLNVLQVTKSTGGVGSYIRWLVAGLDKSRFDLTVICLSDGGPQLAAELSQTLGVNALSFAMNRYHIDPLSDARVLVQLAGVIRRGQFDLIHAHTSKPGYLARLAAAGTRVPVIYRPAGFAFHAGAGRLEAQAVAALERWAARFFTARILTVSEAERDLALRYRVAPPEQMVTIHTGIDPCPFDAPVDRAAVRAELGVPADARVVGVVGRLARQKAPLDFVQAARYAHARRPDVHFVWIGSGPLEGASRAAVEAAGLTANFHFAGERRNMPSVLQALDCFVLPSRWEGFSIAILEAMAARLPIVATRIVGTAEAIEEGVTGFLVPSGDSLALGQAILDLLADPVRAWQFGQRGREKLEREFTRERMIHRLTQLYEEVYEQSSRHKRFLQ